MLLDNKYEYNPETDLIGTGGFGRVYKARNTLLDIDVALKLVTINVLNSHYSLLNEVKKAYNLTHTNILRYNDVFTLFDNFSTGEKIETQVGVMEYIPFGNIGQITWLSLPREKQIDITNQILSGLEYLHHHRIIHRDIKPSNILIKKENSKIIPVIADFGISKMNDSGSVSVSRMIGSIPYMAPEQFDSKGKIDFNTDFWSLGILIFHLFTGKLPFGDESSTSEGVIMKNIIELDVPDLLYEIPDPFKQLIAACLVKDRKKRVHSAEELRVFLLQYYHKEKKAEEPEIDHEEETKSFDDPNKANEPLIISAIVRPKNSQWLIPKSTIVKLIFINLFVAIWVFLIRRLVIEFDLDYWVRGINFTWSMFIFVLGTSLVIESSFRRIGFILLVLAFILFAIQTFDYYIGTSLTFLFFPVIIIALGGIILFKMYRIFLKK